MKQQSWGLGARYVTFHYKIYEYVTSCDISTLLQLFGYVMKKNTCKIFSMYMADKKTILVIMSILLHEALNLKLLV